MFFANRNGTFKTGKNSRKIKKENKKWRAQKERNIEVLSLVLKVTLLHGCFARFLNCTNGPKPRKASHLNAFEVEKRFLIPLLF